jgi:hypothetical protein
VSRRTAEVATGLFVLVAAYALFLGLVDVWQVQTDIPAHVDFVIGFATGRDPWTFNFLYYLAVYALAWGSTRAEALTASALFLLALSVLAKYIVTRLVLLDELTAKIQQQRHGRLLALAIAASLALLVAHSLFLRPWTRAYLGQFSPNVWHNSTTIFLMPFAILLFWSSCRYVERGEPRQIAIMTLLVALNIAIKPSFLLAFLVVWPLALVWRFGIRSRQLWLGLTPLWLGGVLLAGHYVYLFLLHPATAQGQTTSGVRIAFLHVWSLYTRSLPLSLLFSFLFPLVVGVAHRPRLAVGAQWRWWYAAALQAVSVVEFAVLTEVGARETHANFAWQGMIACYLWFLTSVAVALEGTFQERRPLKDAIVASALLAHVAAGIGYFVVMVQTKRIG